MRAGRSTWSVAYNLSAFNHADTEVILHAVDQAPWRDKDAVQVFVREQEEDGFLLRYNGRLSQK
jgi:hypothetical protein